MSVSKFRPRIHHIGLAVEDVAKTASVLNKVFGITFDSPTLVDSQKVRVSYSKSIGMNLELVESTDDKSPLYPILDHPIKAFINNHGEGLHHLCFEIDSLDDFMAELQNKGIEPIGMGIMTGSDNDRIVFLNPEDCAGLLIELREKK